MRRMVWLALGAAGGIVAYRKGQQMWEQANNQGVWVTVSAVSTKAGEVATVVRERIAPGSEK